MLRPGSSATAILIHDQDSRYGASFDHRVRRLGIGIGFQEQVSNPSKPLR
jgi:hypothetical protein